VVLVSAFCHTMDSLSGPVIARFAPGRIPVTASCSTRRDC
jgi:hypothetical protein